MSLFARDVSTVNISRMMVLNSDSPYRHSSAVVLVTNLNLGVNQTSYHKLFSQQISGYPKDISQRNLVQNKVPSEIVYTRSTQRVQNSAKP